MNNLPLVSIIVVAYNSSKYIFETLNSIYKQTYQNIELIITDDNSKDNTVYICKNWLKSNQNRFINTELITSNHNTGITGNINRGYTKVKGKWIKAIAADDILCDNCIELNISYVTRYQNTEILFSKVKPFYNDNLTHKYPVIKYGVFDLSSKELLYLLLTTNYLPAPTLFLRKETYDQLGGFDENFPLLEDWPFWIKALINNKRISFNNEITVYYRMSESSISLSSTPNPLYIESLNKFKKNYLDFYQRKTNILLWFYYKLINYKQNNNILIKNLIKFLIYLNPLYYYIKYINNKVKVNTLKYN